MKTKFLLYGSLLFVMTLLLDTHQGNSQPAATATPTTPPVQVASDMGPPPSNCGILPEAISIDPMIPQAVGTWPIWVALPNVTGETRGILNMPNQHYFSLPQLAGWWTTKVAWFIPISYPGKVRVRGVNVADNSPLFIEANSKGPSEVTVFDPDHPGGSAAGIPNWFFFPSHVWVSKAGCYRLEAEWEGGMWQQVIAVGYVE